MRITWITYKSGKIFYVDYSSLPVENMQKILHDSEKELLKEEKPVLCLFNFTDCFVNDKFMEALKRAGKKCDSKIKKSASFGITGPKIILANMYNRFTGQGEKIGVFKTREDAQNWLVK